MIGLILSTIYFIGFLVVLLRIETLAANDARVMSLDAVGFCVVTILFVVCALLWPVFLLAHFIKQV